MARMSVTKKEILKKKELRGFNTENEKLLLRYFELDNLLQRINRRAIKDSFQKGDIKRINKAFDELMKECEDILD